MLQERIAIASTHMPKVQTDESTMLMTFVTGMLEDEHAKGTGWHVSSHLADYSGQPGRDAARSAIATMGGQRVGSNAYNVVLGPQAITEILEWVLMAQPPTGCGLCRRFHLHGQGGPEGGFRGAVPV